MVSTESFNSFYLQLADIQELSRKLTMPWTSTLQTLAKQAKPIDFDSYSELFKTYSTLADLYRMPANMDSSAFVRQDAGDGMKKKETNRLVVLLKLKMLLLFRKRHRLMMSTRLTRNTWNIFALEPTR